MAIYRVLMAAGTDPAASAERTRFQRDGFSWPAFLFGPLWLAARGMGRAFALWCLAALAVGWAVAEGRLSGGTAAALYGLSALFLGFEGAHFAAAALERGGYRLVDVASGDNRQAAERAFFTRWLDRPESPPPPPARPGGPVPHDGHVIGLFPEAGG